MAATSAKVASSVVVGAAYWRIVLPTARRAAAAAAAAADSVAADCRRRGRCRLGRHAYSFSPPGRRAVTLDIARIVCAIALQCGTVAQVSMLAPSPPLPEPARRHATISPQAAAFWSLFGAVIAGFFFTHHAYGLTFPVPWPDECSFLWPALAFRDTGTLYARELFEPREVFWMPPGYVVLSGAIFKLTGFSLSWARWLSALYLAAAMACLAVALRGRRARLGHVLLIGIFALSPIATLAGNAARMETLVCLLVLGGLALLCSERYVAGLAMLALGPLVHPNALFALLSGLVFAATRGFRAFKPERWELGLVLLAALCWVAYATHVATHWSEFVTDFGAQLAWKRAEFSMSGGVSSRLVKPAVLVVSVLLAVGWVGALRFARHALPFAILASGLLLQVLLTTGWLYDLYAALLYLLVAILVLEVAAALVTTKLDERPASLRIAAMLAVVTVLAAGLLFGLTRDSFANQSPEYVRTHAKTESSLYVRESDRAAVARALLSLPKPVTVQFLPDGDSLLFHDVRSSGLRFAQASFYETRADAYVYHDSVWLHPFVRGLMQGRLAMRQGIGVPIDRWRLLASRAGTDRWLLYERERTGALP